MQVRNRLETKKESKSNLTTENTNNKKGEFYNAKTGTVRFSKKKIGASHKQPKHFIYGFYLNFVSTELVFSFF